MILDQSALNARRCSGSSICSLLILCGCVLLGGSGCKTQGLPASGIADAQQAYDQALELVEQGDFAGAMPLIDQAVQSPALDVDQYTQAVLVRAQCFADAGDIDSAKSDIAEAEMGAPIDAQLHYTKALVFHKAGQTSEAKKELAKARKLDRSIKSPW